MIELVSGGLALLWALCVFLRGLAGEISQWVTQSRALTSSKVRGLEWRTIRPIGGRLVALRLQVVIA